uniref:SBSPON-like C-terminal domain-containing protein n=1 Tax=Amazona collaria TaxID=241587 RepID=A0A8B9FPD6_9PSIT
MLLPEEPSRSPLPSYCGYFRLTQVGPLCRGQAWSRRLHRDKQVCVECRGDTSQHRPHCTGHGLQGARTFWVAASVAGCQGSWVQEGLQEGCVCSPPALIFV